MTQILKFRFLRFTLVIFLLLICIHKPKIYIRTSIDGAILSVVMYLEIFSKESLDMLTEFKKALESVCFDPIKSSKISLQLIFVFNDGHIARPQRFIIDYLNSLQIISNESLSCFTCMVSKFYLLYNFFKKVNDASDTLKNLGNFEEFNKKMAEDFPHLNLIDNIDKISRDPLINKMTDLDTNYYMASMIETPSVFINGIPLDYTITDKNYWLDLIKSNNIIEKYEEYNKDICSRDFPGSFE